MNTSTDYGRPPTLKVNRNQTFPKFSADAVFTSIGSCFADELAGGLLECGFDGARNPNGILYNPVSITEALERVASGEAYAENDFFQFNGQYHSWLHHGSFSSPDPDRAAAQCNRAREAFEQKLRDSDFLAVTLSSAVVYEWTETRRIVANCHKVPGNRFARRLLSPEECRRSCDRIVDAVRRVNSSCRIIFTLSPVRHYPGDPVLNARSKALLLTAIHECCETRELCGYFPAFEIVLDELRDYRYFKEDLVHPNALALRIVTDYFVDSCFVPEAMEKLHRGRLRAASMRHEDRSVR